MKKHITILIFGLLTVVLTSFSIANSYQVNAQTNQKGIEPLKIGDIAPDFNLLGSDGKMYKLSDYKGKLVLLDFWAMWCGPCRKKMPKVQELHDKYKNKGVEVISLLAMNKGAEEKAKQYFKENHFTLKLLYGNDKLTKDYQLKFLPTVVMLDKKGKIIYLTTKPNPNEFDDITKLI